MILFDSVKIDVMLIHIFTYIIYYFLYNYNYIDKHDTTKKKLKT